MTNTTDLYVVVAPRYYEGVNGYNVFSSPLPHGKAVDALSQWESRNPGMMYYLKRYEES